MSHFTVTVAIPGHIAPARVERALDEIMAPFDENTRVDRYVKATKAELIADQKKNHIDTWENGFISRYLDDPAAYEEKTRNPSHVEYIKKLIEENRLNTWTDEQWHQAAIEWEEAEDIGPDGEIYSTYNPKSQWDWFSVGGRWGGMWTLKEGIDPKDPRIVPMGTAMAAIGGPTERMGDERNVDCARVSDIAAESHRATYAYVDLDGEWQAKGEMGWFGMSSGDAEQDVWETQYFTWIKSLHPDTWVVNVDCHI